MSFLPCCFPSLPSFTSLPLFPFTPSSAPPSSAPPSSAPPSSTPPSLSPPHSIEYWFRCMDSDGDGVLSLYELVFFYEEVLQRLQELNIDCLSVENTICQVLDMVNPRDQSEWCHYDVTVMSFMFNLLDERLFCYHRSLKEISRFSQN